MTVFNAAKGVIAISEVKQKDLRWLEYCSYPGSQTASSSSERGEHAKMRAKKRFKRALQLRECAFAVIARG